jgi:sugar phosphate permease
MTSPRARIAVIAALLLTYGSLYLCRANVDAALPFLRREGGYDRATLGQLSSIATLTYAIGKIVLGAAGDALGGRRLMLVAVVGSVGCSLAFGVCRTFAAFIALAAANRFFQAGGWPGLVHVVSRQFDPPRHGLVMGILSTSYELGNVCALLLCGVVVRLGWRALFVVNPLLLATIAVPAILSLREASPRSPPNAAPPVLQSPWASQADAGATLGAALPTLLASGAFWATIVLSALLTFIRIGFLTWLPTYLSEVASPAGGAEISGAIVKSAIFPAAGVVAALTVGSLSDRLGPGRRAPLMAVSLAVLVGLVLLLAHGRPDQRVIVIGAIGLFLLGPYSLLAGAMALDVAGTRGTATAAGMIDGAGYLGATASGYVLGSIADRAGWSGAFDVLAGAALVAALVSAAWAILVARRVGALASPRRGR